MEFRILGGLEAECDGRRVPLGGRREQNVLAALLLNVGRVVPVRRLIDAIWDDDPPATAGKQVRNSISRLRHAMGRAGSGALIVTDAAGYRLAAEECAVDAFAFESMVAEAGLAASADHIAEAAGLLRSALALWCGPALAGLTGRDIESAAAALDERRLAAQELYYGYELALDRHLDVLSELAGLVASSPFREKVVGQYMVALYRSGRQADALAIYLRTRQLLADEMGLDPSPELRRLQQQILTADLQLPPPQGAERLPSQNAALAATSAETATRNVVTRAASVLPQVRYSLPADTSAFTGRGGELEQITAVAGAAAAGGVVAVWAVDGMPGVGKTTLAVHAAHALMAEFPDRQMYIDLHAHTPGRQPIRPEDALAGLLAATGLDPQYMPGDLDGRAAMWRDRMAGQRTLLVLDNAASSGQVAPLIPGGRCLVLVTSRRHLGDLPGAVTPVLLDVLLPMDGEEMFIRLAPRAAADRDGVAEVVRLAGCLPLAISLLARVFARHRSWTLADLTAEIQTGVLTIAAESDSVAAAFDLSYRHLDPAAQRLFRLLGVHPGEVIDGYAAAALAGIGHRQAAGLLDGLHREGLVTDAGYRRYGMHDLLRRYARNLADDDTSKSTHLAMSRLLDYYQYTAALAGERLARHARPGPWPATPCGLEVPELEDAGRALAWLRANRVSLLACLDLVSRAGEHARVVALTAGLAAVLRRDTPWVEAITRHTAAVDAARSSGDRLGEANALTDLGSVLQAYGDRESSAQALEEALRIFGKLGDRLGQANALRELGVMRRQLADDYLSAGQVLEQALGICRDIGDRRGEASSLREIGIARLMTGDYVAAAQVLEQALGICRDLGDRLGEASTLAKLGIMRWATGNFRDATRTVEQALGIYRDLGDRLGQASALHELAAVRRLSGNYVEAASAAEESLGIYRDLGDRLGQANALHNLGAVRSLTGDYLEAASVVEESLDIYRDLGSRLGEANALHELATVRRLTGDQDGAVRFLDESLGIYRDLGDRDGEAEALNEFGTLHRARGDLASAELCHQQALDLARTIGSSQEEACALAGQGRCAAAVGHTTEAEVLLRQALEILQRSGAAEAHEVVAELDALIRAADVRSS